MGQPVGSRDGRLKSRGCFSCIRMKVKCDEEKPQCQRCRRTRRKCPGYRDAQSFVFRMENQHSRSINTRSKAQDKSLVVHRSPTTNWLQCAIAHFFCNFVLLSDDAHPGYFVFLPQLYGGDTASLCLRYTVEAVSMAFFCNVKHMGDSHLRKARTAYGAALRQLGLALKDRNKAISPSGLATVGLLWKYDIIMGENNLNSANPHLKGLLNILPLCLSKNFEGDLWIYRSLLASLQMQYIDPSTPPSVDLPSPLPAPAGTLLDPGIEPAMVLQEQLLPRAVSLTYRISSSIQQMPRIPNVASHTRDILDLRERFQLWEDGLPNVWRYVNLPVLRTTEDYPFPNFSVGLPSVCNAAIWLAYCLGRLSVLRSMSLLCSHAVEAEALLPSTSKLHNEMLSVANSIFAIIPYLLGHVTSEGAENRHADGPAIGAFFAIRSLHICSQIPFLPEQQMMWILSRLKYIDYRRATRLDDWIWSGLDFVASALLPTWREAVVSLHYRLERKGSEYWHDLFATVVLSLTDAQLLTGTAILIAGLLKCDISVYHFNFTTNMGWLAVSTYSIGLTVVRGLLIQYHVTKWIRIAALTVICGLQLAVSIFQGNKDWYEDPRQKAYCLIVHTTENIGSPNQAWMYASIFLNLMMYISTIVQLIEGWEEKINEASEAAPGKLLSWPKSVRSKLFTFLNESLAQFGPFLRGIIHIAIVGLVLVVALPLFVISLATAVIILFFNEVVVSFWIGTAQNIIWFALGVAFSLSDRRDGREYMTPAESHAEDKWGFGQTVPMLLLIVPLIGMLDTSYRAYVDSKRQTLPISSSRESQTALVPSTGVDVSVPLHSYPHNLMPGSESNEVDRRRASITSAHESQEGVLYLQSEASESTRSLNTVQQDEPAVDAWALGRTDSTFTGRDDSSEAAPSRRTTFQINEGNEGQ
ncbi:hypothetical protein G7046_g1476 [Stylonectria norvegica]|nr:hypothetical protein G7046_g1476 [Stylonectria norvegica]